MGTQSKLAQARIERDLTQAEVAEYAGVDIATVCRWEKGTHHPYPRHVIKLCTLFEKPAAQLGLAPVEQNEAPSSSTFLVRSKDDHPFAKYFERDIELRLHHIIYDWLHRERLSGSSCAMLQYRLSQELEGDVSMNEQPDKHEQSQQNGERVDIPRRDALRRIALLPIQALGLDALAATRKWAPEDILPHCAAGITACEQLSKGQGEDMSLAYGVLTTYLPPLKEIVDQSSLHRQEASRLVAQALLIKATLSLHREGPKRAISYGKQADIFSKESGNIPLQLIILKRLAWMYACDKQQKQALDTVLKAKSLLLKQQKKGLPVHSFIQSTVYGGVAKYQARNGLDEEALVAIHEAKKAFFTSPSSGDDTAAIVDDFNYSTLLLEDGLTYYYLDQYEKALEVFAHAVDLTTLDPKVPASSVRTRVEIINNETLASLKSPKKDMDLSIRLWKAGIQGAIDLRSEQRFGEALTAYDIMQALWPGDKRIKELRDLTRHW
jgi:transcriptional regulator with XRE-family HTH domain/tetratricopeptide (TPR) repeat protein